MPSVVFQPLLQNSIGFKNLNSTYADHYKWKQYHHTLKDKKISPYGQEYQKQQLKIQQQSNKSPKSEHSQSESLMTIKRVENRQEKRSDDNNVKSVKFKHDDTLIDDPNDSEKAVYIVEWKRRPSSTIENQSVKHKLETEVPQRPKTVIAKSTTEKDETIEKTPIKRVPIDPNDPTRHWLTYPNPTTPQYLIDIKKRLGQLRSDPPKLYESERSLSALSQNQVSNNERNQQSRPSFASQPVEHNFLSYIANETPLELRTSRYRLRKERYNPSLDNFPSSEVKEAFTRDQRPHTVPVSVQRQREDELEKKQTDDESTNSQVWTTMPSSNSSVVQQQENGDQNSSDTVYVQVVDCDGLPNEYIDALETASDAQEHHETNKYSSHPTYYESQQKQRENNLDEWNYNERPTRRPMTSLNAVADRTETPPYRVSSANGTHRLNRETITPLPSNDQSHPLRNMIRSQSRSSEFGTWVRNATDKERESAMSILQNVLRQPVIGYDHPAQKILQKNKFLTGNKPPGGRASSARKLGRTRTTHQFPCEICEKLLIKRHVWDLNRVQCPNCTVVS